MRERPWLDKIILVVLIPVFCYLPAFGLVLLSTNLFKPSNLPSTSSKPSSTQNSPVVAPSPGATLSPVNPTTNKSVFTSPEASVYIDLIKLSVESEVRKQSEQAAKDAAKDEVEKLKAEYKGDVFVQIAFPVLFAIASIFAAFAVKDIVAKILEQQEQDRIKTELETTLKNQIVPKAVAEENQEITDRLDNIDAYAHWLEYQVLSILITQTIDELKKSSISLQNEPKLLSAITKLTHRSIVTLKDSSSHFCRKYFNEIKEYEKQIIQKKLNSVKLSAKQINALLLPFDESSASKIEPEVYPGQSIFQAQIGLLRIVMSRSLLTGEECSTEQKKLLDELDGIIAENPRDEYDKHTKNVAKIEEESQIKPKPLP